MSICILGFSLKINVDQHSIVQFNHFWNFQMFKLRHRKSRVNCDEHHSKSVQSPETNLKVLTLKSLICIYMKTSLQYSSCNKGP